LASPVESRIVNLQVLHHAGVVNDEVIAGIGFKKFLLDGHPEPVSTHI